MTRRLLLWLMVGAFGLPALGWAGVIRGTLHQPAAEPSIAAKRTMTPSNSHAPVPEAAGPRRKVIDAVMYVEPVPARAEAILALARSVPATLAQLHRVFVPRVLPIAAGDTVAAPHWHPDLRGLRREVRVPDHGDLVIDLSL